jgi:hypothetical protein
VQKRLGELAKLERQIKSSPNLSTEQKDVRLPSSTNSRRRQQRSFLQQLLSGKTTPR